MLIRKKRLIKLLNLLLIMLLFFSTVTPVSALKRDSSELQFLYEEPVTTSSQLPASLEQSFLEEEEVTFIVKFREKADLEKALEIAKDKSIARNLSVYHSSLLEKSQVITELKTVAQVEQANVKNYLDQEVAKGTVTHYESFYIVNSMAVTAGKEVAEKLLSFAEVEAILPNQVHELHQVTKTGVEVESDDEVEWNVKRVGAPEVWEMGYDGNGVVVGIIDSGVQWDHPALKHSYRGYDEKTGEVDHSYSWFDATENKLEPYDDIGHGTHVTGTVAGAEPDGKNQIGVAPGAKWIHVKAFSNIGGTDVDLLRAGQWILAPTNAEGIEDPTLAPDIVNNSWGGNPGLNEWYRDMVIAWRTAGIFPEFSAGNITLYNPGGPGSVAVPANYPESFATGSIDVNNRVADSSLRGPSPYGEIKPDIAAPGVNIRSAVPGNGYEGDWSGTSMAGPAVTGSIALLLQADPSLSVSEIEEIIKETATPLTDADNTTVPNNSYGHGLVDAYRAVLSVTDGLGDIDGYVYGYGGSTPLQATVTAQNDHKSRVAKTDSDTGFYKLKYAPGEFRFIAESYGHYPEEKTVEVIKDGRVELNFELRELPKGMVKGKVVNKSTGKAIEDATIYVVEDAKVAPVETNEMGEYELEAYEGEYTLRVVAHNHHVKEVNVSISGGELTRDIELDPYYTYPGEEIYYDSGHTDTAIALYTAGAGLAVKMSLPEGRDRAIVTGGKFLFAQESFPNPGGTKFLVEVWDASGDDGRPGKRIAGPVEGEAIRDRVTWTHVDLWSENIVVEDDFYMVYIQKYEVPYVPGLVIDRTGPYSQRNFQYDGEEWEQSFADMGNYMIRAQVAYEVEKPHITSFEDETTYTNQEQIEVSGLASPTSTIEIYQNAELVAKQEIGQTGQFSQTLTLEKGKNTIEAAGKFADDYIGSSDVYEVVYDTELPNINIVSPRSELVTNQDLIVVSGQVSDNYGVESLKINQKSALLTEGEFSEKIILEEGKNEVILEALDLAGNVKTETIVVYRDTNPPALKSILPEQNQYVLTGDEVHISFESDTVNAEAYFAIHLPGTARISNFSNRMEETSPGKYEGIWQVPEKTNVNNLLVSVKLIDSAGNETVGQAAGKIFVSDQELERISGKTRIDTAVEISKRGWDQAETVILSRADDFADALAGTPLAYELNAPVLLTKSKVLSTETLGEIKRLAAKKVIVLGGNEAVNDQVLDQLLQEGLEVERISGKTRYDTALEIAKRLELSEGNKVAIVNGHDFPDAISIAPQAAKEGIPILLTKRSELPNSTLEWLKDQKIEESYVVGGSLAVSDEVLHLLPNALRISGKDRIETNLAVQKQFPSSSSWLYFATGEDFADALTGAVLAAKHDSTIFLVRSRLLKEAKELMESFETKKVSILGGRLAISEEVERDLRKFLKQ